MKPVLENRKKCRTLMYIYYIPGGTRPQDPHFQWLSRSRLITDQIQNICCIALSLTELRRWGLNTQNAVEKVKHNPHPPRWRCVYHKVFVSLKKRERKNIFHSAAGQNWGSTPSPHPLTLRWSSYNEVFYVFSKINILSLFGD